MAELEKQRVPRDPATIRVPRHETSQLGTNRRTIARLTAEQNGVATGVATPAGERAFELQVGQNTITVKSTSVGMEGEMIVQGLGGPMDLNGLTARIKGTRIDNVIIDSEASTLEFGYLKHGQTQVTCIRVTIPGESTHIIPEIEKALGKGEILSGARKRFELP